MTPEEKAAKEKEEADRKAAEKAAKEAAAAEVEEEEPEEEEEEEEEPPRRKAKKRPRVVVPDYDDEFAQLHEKIDRLTPKEREASRASVGDILTWVAVGVGFLFVAWAGIKSRTKGANHGERSAGPEREPGF